MLNLFLYPPPVPDAIDTKHLRREAPRRSWRHLSPQSWGASHPIQMFIQGISQVVAHPLGRCFLFVTSDQPKKKWTEWLDLCQPLDKIRCSPVCYLSCQPTTQGCRPALGFWYFDLKKDMVQAWLQQGSYRHHGPEKQESFLKLPLFNMFHWNFKLYIVIIVII